MNYLRGGYLDNKDAISCVQNDKTGSACVYEPNLRAGGLGLEVRKRGVLVNDVPHHLKNKEQK